MKLILTVTMDNAAFHDNDPGEIVRILREAAATLDREGVYLGVTFNLRDINGNTVGTVKVNEQ